MKVVLGSFIMYLLATGKLARYYDFATIPYTTLPTKGNSLYDFFGMDSLDRFVWEKLIMGK